MTTSNVPPRPRRRRLSPCRRPHLGPLVAGGFALAGLLAACGATGPTAAIVHSPAGPTGAPAVPSPASPGGSGPMPAASPTPTPSPTPAPTMPSLRHVYVIVMENKDFASIVGSPDAPYINQLIARYGLAAKYSAVSHPSQPNYLALFSGSTHGVGDDGVHDVSGPNLADQLEAHGRSWRVYAQNMPPGCFTGAVAEGGADGRGSYARKHNPAISFTDISRNPARCARIGPFTGFDPGAADFELVLPNSCNDMHDCSVATGDAFLRSFVPRITASPDFPTSALFLVWDEATDTGEGGGRVAALVISPLVHAGFVSNTSHDHYSLLRTIEDAWGLGCLAESCSAVAMAEFFAR